MCLSGPQDKGGAGGVPSWAERLPASLLTCHHRPGLSAALTRRAAGKGDALGQGRGSLVRGLLGPPPTSDVLREPCPQPAGLGPLGGLSTGVGAGSVPGCPRPMSQEPPVTPILRPLRLPGAPISPKPQSFPPTTYRGPPQSPQSRSSGSGLTRDRSLAPWGSVRADG